VRKNLLHMLKETSALEQKWLIRMIMKDMKMGLSQQSVFSLYHEDAEDLFNVKMSLEKVTPAFSSHRLYFVMLASNLSNFFTPLQFELNEGRKCTILNIFADLLWCGCFLQKNYGICLVCVCFLWQNYILVDGL